MNATELFWSKVNIGANAVCWPWKLRLKSHGYGETTHDGQWWRTHRLAWFLTYGDIPSGLFVCHRCDNKACCNPAHLFLGTPLDNMRDMVAKGRLVVGRRYRGEANSNARLTDEQVRAIRQLRQWGLTHREIASMFPVSSNIVGRIVRGEHWIHEGS